MINTVKKILTARFDAQVVEELSQAYLEAKKNYYEGGHRLSAVEGGRFCEAAFRLLEQHTSGTFTPIGVSLNTENLIRTLAALSSNSFPKSVRIHIPRTLRVVYDIRNNRDTAHLADGIDPNIQDATLVISNLNWVLAEFVRLFHGVSAAEAQGIIDEISIRQLPVIQEFDGFPRVLRTDLGASDLTLVLLYHAGPAGVSYQKLSQWVRPSMRSNLRRTLRQLDDKAFLHTTQDKIIITNLGKQAVENRRLMQFN
jgi:hypothetical protein